MRSTWFANEKRMSDRFTVKGLGIVSTNKRTKLTRVDGILKSCFEKFLTGPSRLGTGPGG